MRRSSIWLISAAAMMVAVAPAYAGFKLMPANQPVFVAASGLNVTPAEDWNRLGKRDGANAESWTLDGMSLNDLTFYGGVPHGATLFREVNKTERPLPRFQSSMLLPDIAQLFENSYRIARNTSLFSIDAIEPGSFAGHDGFRFTYSFAVQGEEVKRKGEAVGAIVGQKLYMISYETPVIHYFDRDLEAFRRLAATARIMKAPKAR